VQDSSLNRLGMARANEGSYSFTCHSHVYPQMKWATLPLLPATEHHCITVLWLVLISCATEGKRLNAPRWLITYQGDKPSHKWSSMPILTGLESNFADMSNVITATPNHHQE